MNKQSGMQGLAGYSDMRDVEAEYLKGNPRAIDALEAYVYTITKFIGSYCSHGGSRCLSLRPALAKIPRCPQQGFEQPEISGN